MELIMSFLLRCDYSSSGNQRDIKNRKQPCFLVLHNYLVILRKLMDATPYTSSDEDAVYLNT